MVLEGDELTRVGEGPHIGVLVLEGSPLVLKSGCHSVASLLEELGAVLHLVVHVLHATLARLRVRFVTIGVAPRTAAPIASVELVGGQGGVIQPVEVDLAGSTLDDAFSSVAGMSDASLGVTVEVTQPLQQDLGVGFPLPVPTHQRL